MFKFKFLVMAASENHIPALIEMLANAGAKIARVDGTIIEYRATLRQYHVFENMLLSAYLQNATI